MSIALKTPEEIEKMRVAGRLAAEVLDYIEPFVPTDCLNPNPMPRRPSPRGDFFPGL